MQPYTLSEYISAVRDLLTEFCEFCLEVTGAYDPTVVFVVGLLSQQNSLTNSVTTFMLSL